MTVKHLAHLRNIRKNDYWITICHTRPMLNNMSYHYDKESVPEEMSESKIKTGMFVFSLLSKSNIITVKKTVGKYPTRS